MLDRWLCRDECSRQSACADKNFCVDSTHLPMQLKEQAGFPRVRCAGTHGELLRRLEILKSLIVFSLRSHCGIVQCGIYVALYHFGGSLFLIFDLGRFVSVLLSCFLRLRSKGSQSKHHGLCLVAHSVQHHCWN